MALYRFFFAPVLLAVAVLAGRVEKARTPAPAPAALRQEAHRAPEPSGLPRPAGGDRAARRAAAPVR